MPICVTRDIGVPYVWEEQYRYWRQNHYLNLCCNILFGPSRKMLQRNFNQCNQIVVQEKVFVGKVPAMCQGFHLTNMDPL